MRTTQNFHVRRSSNSKKTRINQLFKYRPNIPSNCKSQSINNIFLKRIEKEFKKESTHQMMNLQDASHDGYLAVPGVAAAPHQHSNLKTHSHVKTTNFFYQNHT